MSTGGSLNQVAEVIVMKFAAEFKLSTAETQVLALATVGIDTKAMAAMLGCGRATIDTYWKRTFKKTNTGSQRTVMAALFRFAVRHLESCSRSLERPPEHLVAMHHPALLRHTADHE